MRGGEKEDDEKDIKGEMFVRGKMVKEQDVMRVSEERNLYTDGRDEEREGKV